MQTEKAFNFLKWAIPFAVLVLLSSCSFSDKHSKRAPISAKPRANYKFAYSGRLKAYSTNESIEDYSVEILKGTNVTILNPSGSVGGIVHLSRQQLDEDPVAVFIYAKGYFPKIMSVNVGSDCLSGKCSGKLPQSIHLNRRVQKKKGTRTPPSSQFTPVFSTESLYAGGALALLRQARRQNKVDASLGEKLLEANNGDLLHNIVVVLEEGGHAEVIEHLLSNVGGSRIAAILNEEVHPLSSLLPERFPRLSKAIVNTGQLLAYLGRNPSARFRHSSLSQLLQQLESKEAGGVPLTERIEEGAPVSGTRTTWAAFGLFDTIGEDGLKGREALSPFSALVDVMKRAGRGREKKLKEFPQLQVLVQGFFGPKGEALRALFNRLVRVESPFERLKRFPERAIDLEEYGELLPYIEPIIVAIKSKQGTRMEAFLRPYLLSENPAQAMLLDVIDESGKMGRHAGDVFPSLSLHVEQWVQAKELFTAQLLQGLVSGDFRNLRCIRDLKGAPAILVSGRAQDLLKLSSLPNVAYLLAISE